MIVVGADQKQDSRLRFVGPCLVFHVPWIKRLTFPSIWHAFSICKTENDVCSIIVNIQLFFCYCICLYRVASLALQKDLDNLTQWIDIWLLRLNIGKCKAVSYDRRPEICINYNISGEIIEKK